MEKLGEKKEVKTPSVKELNEMLNQAESRIKELLIERQKLIGELQKLQVQDFYIRLDWLWKIITVDTPFITDDFRQKKAEEFMMFMTPVEEEPKEEKDA